MSDQITPILMPKWGLSMREGILAKWHVAEGTTITPGDEIMDVETDKIANVVEAADGGLLRRRVAEEGKVYPVRALLGVMAPSSVSDAEVAAYVDSFKAPEAAEEEQAGPAYQFVDLPVGRIRYSVREGEGTPVVLVHGFGGDLDNWLFNIDALAEAAPVYALDLPGHGQSVKAVDKPGLATMVDTLVQFLDHHAIGKAHFIGHSMGGLIAGRIAADHPGRVASLNLICSAGLGDEINSGYTSGFVAAGNRKELKEVLLNLFADSNLVSRAMVDDLLKYKRLDGVPAFLGALGDALFAKGRQAEQVAAALTAAGVPVQVIWGEHDAIIPAAHAKALDNAAVHVLPGAGHMVQMEKAAEVNRLLRAFISG